MYLILAPSIINNYTINYQSVGREVQVLTNLKALRTVKEQSEVIVFYSSDLIFQEILDLYYLLDLKFIIITNNDQDEKIFKEVFFTHRLNYSMIDGKLIGNIKNNDKVALDEAQKHIGKRSKPWSYSSEADYLLESASSNQRVKNMCCEYKNLYASYIELCDRYSRQEETFAEMNTEQFGLRQALSKIFNDMRSFVSYFTNIQNSYKSIAALTVFRDRLAFTLPSHITSLVCKDYGIPNLFLFVQALYDSLTTLYKMYTKIVYIAEPDGVLVNLVPNYYTVITNTVQAGELLDNDFIACVGNVNTPMEVLIQSTAADTLIIVDSRRDMQSRFNNATLELSLAPDIYTVEALNLDADTTVTPSARSKYTLKEEVFASGEKYGACNAKLISNIVNTLLAKKGVQ